MKAPDVAGIGLSTYRSAIASSNWAKKVHALRGKRWLAWCPQVNTFKLFLPISSYSSNIFLLSDLPSSVRSGQLFFSSCFRLINKYLSCSFFAAASNESNQIMLYVLVERKSRQRKYLREFHFGSVTRKLFVSLPVLLIFHRAFLCIGNGCQ